jgi:hypothetical protein
MTDWGIPDWHDPRAYGDTKRWSEHRWRWEFTRRREDCRADFLAHKDETVRFHEAVRARESARAPVGDEAGAMAAIKGHLTDNWPGNVPRMPILFQNEKRGRLLRPDEPGFVARCPGCHEKYGLAVLPNPAIGDQPFYVIMFYHGGLRLMCPENIREMYQENAPSEPFKPTDAIVIFDLKAPLGNQLKRAKPSLEFQQKKKVGHVVTRGKRHPAKWLTYLRVLDARERNASYVEIAKGVLGWTKQHPRTDPQQMARDVVEQAEALRDKWPI